ncbi:MAG: FliA/WhiG family RNA polymerase sigma factor [Deltaproteobacteria bacterium]|nr:FliA/WhiG family RNA polymerase sigma factor [Deltaproteobacteria bacterium]
MSSQETEKIIKDFLPVVRYKAYRLSRRLPLQISVEDLVSVGLNGLLDALGRFVPGKVKLKNYARYRIKGAMLDELRKAEWVPRSRKKKIKTLKEVQGRLEEELKRPPEDEEVAGALNISLNEYYQILEESQGGVTFQFEDLESATVNLMDHIQHPNNKDPLNLLEELDQKKIIAHLIEGLPEKEKMVISLYYWKEMTMKQVGVFFGLTESRICQLHNQALMRLKRIINEETDLGLNTALGRRPIQIVDRGMKRMNERKKDGKNRIN